MNLLLRAAAAAALLLPLAVAPATAQNYRGAWTLYGGGVWFSDLNNNGDVTFTEDDELLFEEIFDTDLDLIDDEFGFADLSLEPGWIAGTQLEYWFGNGRFGLRANGSYTERSLDLEFDDLFFDGFAGDEDFVFGDVNTWFVDGDLMIRILSPDPDRTFSPFLSLGAGVAIYNPAGNDPVFIPEANSVIGDVDIDVIDDDLVLVAGESNSETVFATPVGLGVDIVTGWDLFGGIGSGIRLEVVDHIAWDSPAEPIFGDDDYDPVHNVRFTAGLMTTFGRLFEEEVVAVAPPPPAPPAPPAEEAVTVCVIDPATYEIGYVNAVYVPTTGDTLVTVNGQRTPVATAFPERAPLYVGTAGWYTAGEPLTVTVGDMDTEWVTYGGARFIEPDDLAFVGTVNGTPVYAAEDDIDDIRDELDDVRDAHDDDLEDMLEERAELHEEVRELEILYVPLESGCVFQPMRLVEEVRKVRG